MKEGFTKAYRKELHSDIWRMPPLYHRVFFYLRQKACWKNDSFPTRKGFGIALCPGQLITSLSLISQEVAWQEYGIKRSPNKKTVRDILSWLSDNSMIEIESNRHGTFIIIVNWDTYQPPPTEEVTQKKRKRNAKETQKKRSTDTLKEDKELNKENKKENKKEKKIFGKFQNVALATDELKKLTEQFGDSLTKEKIENLSLGIASKGYKYKSHYATILSWDRKNSKNPNQQTSKADSRPVPAACPNCGRSVEAADIKNGRCPICDKSDFS